MEFVKDDLVTFQKGLYGDEEGNVYRVIEVNGDRGFIVLANTDLPIPPQSVALFSELEMVSTEK